MNRRELVAFFYILMRDHGVTRDQILSVLREHVFNVRFSGQVSYTDANYQMMAEYLADAIWRSSHGDSEREQANVRQVQGALPSVHIRKDD